MSYEAFLLRADALVETTRALFLVALALWAILGIRRHGSPIWALVGVLGGNAAVWAMSSLPLDRLYAVGVSSDRLNNLGFCQVVAAGNSPLETWQVGHIHFEPLWGFLIAILSGFDPERVPHIYSFMPLVTACAFALTLYLGLRPARDEMSDGVDAPWSGWERAMIAGFATLLSSSPTDYLGTYRTPWAMMFMLKPNHAVGLVLFPLFLRVLVRARDLKRLIAAGLLLHLIGWAFVLHMAYVCVGLLVIPGLAWLRRDWTGLRRGAWELAVVVGVSVVIVSPYLLMLLVGYPFLAVRADSRINLLSAHLLETTVQVGWVFWLGAWGLIVAWRRKGRLARIWEAQVIGAYLVWIGYYALSALHIAREIDEIYFWSRFLMAASAGVGAWDLARRLCSWSAVTLQASVRMAVLALLLVPWMIPYWWNPLQMDSYFYGTLKPLPAIVVEPTLFLRHNTNPRAVIASDPEYAQYVAALGARRVLYGWRMNEPSDIMLRKEIQDRLVRGERLDRHPVRGDGYDVRYLLVTEKMLQTYPDVTLRHLLRRPDLALVHMTGDPEKEFVAIFEISERRTM